MMKPLGILALSLLGGAAAQAGTTAQVNALFRLVKPDGVTVIAQVPITPAGGVMATITVSESNALVAANGRCAFNVKYDEVSPVAASNTTNRLYSNDTLIAQNTKIDLQPNVLRTIWTQPYLYAGPNNVKVVINADSLMPSVGWVRINVQGTCGGTPPATSPHSGTTPAPSASTPAPAPVRVIAPGSAEWNALYTAWGYSNYATTQLRNKGYAKYEDLVRLNADLAAAVAAGHIDQPAYAALIARWNAIASDPAFKAAMASVQPSGGGK